MERRAVTELRSSGRRLEGYAARFNEPAKIQAFTEIIRPGAFRDSLSAVRDVLALVDHDPSRLLARTKSGTLELHEDSDGLAFRIDVPDTQVGRDVLALAERGDLGGMSFGFTVNKGGERWQSNRRELTSVSLHEVSVIHSWPAYDGTIVEPRIDKPALNIRLRYLETCKWES